MSEAIKSSDGGVKVRIAINVLGFPMACSNARISGGGIVGSFLFVC
jgi:hypothetical protein